MAKKTQRKKVVRKKRTTRRKAAEPAAISQRKKKRVGRPPFQPNDEQRDRVEKAVGFGLRLEDICQLILNPTTGKPIDELTLVRYFKPELESGAPKAHEAIAHSLYQKATGDGPQAVTAAIWFSKCRMGWKERVVAEVEVKSGVLVAPAGMSPEDWVRAAQQRAAETGTEKE